MAKALSPARVREVLVDDEARQAVVIVPDDQLSLAIGKEGMNARLAARLTGWRIDIKSESTFASEEENSDYADELEGGVARCAFILQNGRRCPNAVVSGTRYCALEGHTAEASAANMEAFEAAQAAGTIVAEDASFESDAELESELVAEVEAEVLADDGDASAPGDAPAVEEVVTEEAVIAADAVVEVPVAVEVTADEVVATEIVSDETVAVEVSSEEAADE